jgi:hypothetical protein
MLAAVSKNRNGRKFIISEYKNKDFYHESGEFFQ